MKITLSLVLALAVATPVSAQTGPGHSGHAESGAAAATDAAPPMAHAAADHGAAATPHEGHGAMAAPAGGAEAGMACCKEEPAEPCTMPCCARMRQQAGNADGSAVPAPAPADEHGSMQH